MMLLDAGADVNCLDHQNLTPLHQAVIHGNRDAAELLLCYGANIYNAEGITDTMSAAELVDHVPVCQMLFSNAMGESHDIVHKSLYTAPGRQVRSPRVWGGQRLDCL